MHARRSRCALRLACPPLAALALVSAVGLAPAAEPGAAGLHVAQTLEVQVGATAGARRIVLLADDERIAARLDVFRPGVPPPAQQLPADVQESPNGGTAPSLVAQDLDGDGNRDLMLLSWWGATGNRGYLAWRFDVASDGFVAIPGFEELCRPEVEPGKPCVRTHSVGGHAGMIFTRQRWCWREGRLELVWSQVQDADDDDGHVRVTSELRDGVMVEIDRRTVTEEMLLADESAAAAATTGR